MKLIIDRQEENQFVCEDENCGIVLVLVSDVQAGARSGDIITLSGDKYIILTEETEKRRKEILDLQNSLWED